MALVRLRICAGWSESLLVAHTSLLEISRHGSLLCCGYSKELRTVSMRQDKMKNKITITILHINCSFICYYGRQIPYLEFFHHNFLALQRMVGLLLASTLVMLNISIYTLLPNFYPVNLQHSSFKNAYSIRVANRGDSDQAALSEAS